MDFYFVNPSYVQYLKTIDPQVPDVQYAKRNKFLCGIVLDVKGKQYFSPISSFNKQQRTNFVIKDKNGNDISSLRLSFMLPIPQGQLTPYQIEQEPDLKYRELLRQEISYIRANEPSIKKKAQEVYSIGNNRNHYLSKNCCDFAKLEREATAEGFAAFLAGSSSGSAASQPAAVQSTDGTEQATAQPTVSSQLLSMASNIPVAPQSGAAQPQATKKNDNVNEN